MSTPAKRFLIVDGHSVLFHWEDMRRLHDRQQAKARQLLHKELDRLHDTGDWLVTLVFDGKQGTDIPAVPGQMAVIYSKSGQTADSIIERLVASAPDPARVRVITADHAEQLTVESLGAECLSPDWLRDEIRRNAGDWEGTMSRIRKNAEW